MKAMRKTQLHLEEKTFGLKTIAQKQTWRTQHRLQTMEKVGVMDDGDVT